MNINEIKAKLKSFFDSVSMIQRGMATEALEAELAQIENIYALLIFGCFVGMPTPPVHITLRLLPEMQEELILMMNRVSVAKGPISELFSTLDVI
ncbi:hypothetical protein DRP43_02220 [candidate division TA06 bacterium]|uniref:Uncharacterized protein n=1 Tax=candidate division TA06 bacterium TaxID=2250710 RepID=A0A660SLQ7_UNCT6|nr:MAG: hypothetical protein DRP43_02220 [candidate division TA06 bacterium]